MKIVKYKIRDKNYLNFKIFFTKSFYLNKKILRKVVNNKNEKENVVKVMI